MGLAASQPAPVRGDAGGFQVIVSSANPVAALSRADIAGCYMGEPRQWSDGEPVVPVDQSAKSPVRAAFSQVVLGRSVDAVQIHWMKLITAGRSRRPPLTASEQDILNMVARERRMVGYVSAEIPLPPTVKAVALRD
jgi:hypothetical protein